MSYPILGYTILHVCTFQYIRYLGDKESLPIVALCVLLVTKYVQLHTLNMVIILHVHVCDHLYKQAVLR